MDSSASSHMSFNSGNMLSLTVCTSRSIMVVNGVVLHVSHIGHTLFPHSHNHFALDNVLVSNKIIKSIVYVCQFTTNNYVSVTFISLFPRFLSRFLLKSVLWSLFLCDIVVLEIPALLFWIFCTLVNLSLVVQISFPLVTLVNLGSIVIYLFHLPHLKRLTCLN